MLLPRVVHVSLATGVPNRSSDGSYTASTCRHGLPDRQNILGRVHIAVMLNVTPWTGPSAHAQWQCVQHMSTGRTLLTTGTPSIDLDDRDAGRLGLDHSDRHANRRVRERTGQVVVLNQAPEIEVFEIDRIETPNEVCTEFMERVTTGIGNPFVEAGHPACLCPPTIRTFLRSGQPPLGARQQSGTPKQVLGIRDGLSIRERGQAREAEVDPDGAASLDPLRGGSFDLYHHRHVVPTRWMPRHSDGGGIGLHATADPEIEHAELGQRQSLRRAVESAGASRIGRAVSRPTFFLERGIGVARGKKVHEGGVQMSQGLLERNAGHVIKKSHLGVLFQGCQFLIASRIGEPLATLEGGRSGSQHAVIDQAATAKGLR